MNWRPPSATWAASSSIIDAKAAAEQNNNELKNLQNRAQKLLTQWREFDQRHEDAISKVGSLLSAAATALHADAGGLTGAAGESGAAVLNQPAVASWLDNLHDHGMDRDRFVIHTLSFGIMCLTAHVIDQEKAVAAHEVRHCDRLSCRNSRC